MAAAEGELAASILKQVRFPPAGSCPEHLQVEYYFSDANLKRDHFFQKEIAKDSDGQFSSC